MNPTQKEIYQMKLHDIISFNADQITHVKILKVEEGWLYTMRIEAMGSLPDGVTTTFVRENLGVTPAVYEKL